MAVRISSAKGCGSRSFQQ